MKKLTFVMLLCAAVAFPQVAENANKGYKTKEGRESVARTLADPARDEHLRPREIVAAMGLKVGVSVADVGTGVGFMLPYFSHVVGDTGQVIAEDISDDFLDKAKSRVQLQGLKNVKFVLGTERDPKLPADTLEAVLLLDVYHHFDYPEAMLGHIRDSLLSEGKLVIVDFYKRPDAMPGGRAMEHIRLDMDDVIKEVEQNGFTLSSKQEWVPKQAYMAIFVKK
ncbi:MAG TPA: methyltransferase domain-containing protein [Bryobacteraceae bacterium]|nr:methyltransferase domain-containing protein [Bryobacteraceae bacterium]